MTIKIKAGFDKRTPLRVDVSNSSIEEKKKVQDVFFALGYKWEGSSGEFLHLYEDGYTNHFDGFAETTDHLKWCFSGAILGKTSLTPQQFFDLVLEKDTMDIKEVIERGLAGATVLLRDGRKAYLRHLETELEIEYPLIGLIIDSAGSPSLNSWTATGRHINKEIGRGGDIIGLWVEKPVFDYWHLLNPEIKFIAMDKDGTWVGRAKRPETYQIAWWASSGAVHFLDCLNVAFPECEWQDSLIERPVDV